ncbi:MAG: hypothetical protein N4A47_07070 [Clostridia bacterium]|jgi:hypothetical protein|nr:hypothetical protein [Clostridia bacterium]
MFLLLDYEVSIKGRTANVKSLTENYTFATKEEIHRPIVKVRGTESIMEDKSEGVKNIFFRPINDTFGMQEPYATNVLKGNIGMSLDLSILEL